MQNIKPPKYVWFGEVDRRAMRLRTPQTSWLKKSTKEVVYFRDAGIWECHAELNEQGQWISKNCYSKDMDYLSGEILTPCTKKEWRQSNKGYI